MINRPGVKLLQLLLHHGQAVQCFLHRCIVKWLRQLLIQAIKLRQQIKGALRAFTNQLKRGARLAKQRFLL